MSHKSDLKYRSRMGFSWYGSLETPAKKAVSLTAQTLAERLEEIARELHMGYRNPETRSVNILLALYLLDILQAELD